MFPHTQHEGHLAHPTGSLTLRILAKVQDSFRNLKLITLPSKTQSHGHQPPNSFYIQVMLEDHDISYVMCALSRSPGASGFNVAGRPLKKELNCFRGDWKSHHATKKRLLLFL